MSERGSYIALAVFLAVSVAFIVTVQVLGGGTSGSFGDEWDYVRPD